jgi:spoIIIJ-associated protein
MEWVETTGKTILEAKEAALDELGVDEQDAEFEIVEEPKVGLFGRLRTEGRVRARVRPSTPRAKEDRRDRRRRTKGSSSGESSDRSNGDGAPSKATPIKSAATKSPAKDTTAKAIAAGTPEDETNDDTPSSSSTTRSSKSRSRRRGARRPDATPVAGQASDDSPAKVNGSAPANSAAETPPSRRRASRGPRTTSTDIAARLDAVDNGALTEGTNMDVALEEQGQVATAFLRGLVDGFGLGADIEVNQPDDDTLSIQLTGGDLGLLIGPKGATLLSIQDLTRTVVQRRTGAGNGRIYVDVSGYRQKRSEALARFTEGVAANVVSSQQRVALEPMSAPDRKVVHDTAAGIEGVATLSEGEEPRRRVVILPSED